MSRPRRSLPGRLAVLLGSTLLALLALELAVRWLGPTFRPRSLDDKRLFTRFDPELGWANRADVTAVVSGPGYVHRATHSAAALRDREHARARTPGIRRVLVLGDSFVWGLGVADDEIFPRLLALHRSHIETIAMGTSGYGTDQELLWYSRDGAPYRPDLVVLALYLPNDARSNLGDRACSRRKPRFELVDGALRLTGTPVPRETRWWHDAVIDPLLDPVRGHSALYALVEARRHRLHERFRHRAWYRRWLGEMAGGDWTDLYRRTDPGSLAPALDLTAALVAELDRRVRAHGGQLLVLLLPHAVEVEPGAWARFLAHTGLPAAGYDPDVGRRRMAERLEREGIACLDPAAAMRAAGRSLFFPADEHLNPEGHRVVAEVLAAQLLQMWPDSPGQAPGLYRRR